MQTQVQEDAIEHLNTLWRSNSHIRDKAKVTSDVALLRAQVLLFYDRFDSSRAEHIGSLRAKLWNIALARAEFALARMDIFELATELRDFIHSNAVTGQQRASIASFKGSAQQLYEFAENQHLLRLQRIQSECDVRQPTLLAEKLLRHIKSISNENIR